ncbi:MAG: putative solute-binding protein [Bradymonadia bacterium]
MTKTNIRAALMATAALVGTLAASSAFAGEAKTLCVYDPSGANGDSFQFMKDYKTAAVAWGVDFTLKPFTDEKIAAEDFKASQCDVALLTGTRTRAFNKFTGTIEAMGALSEYPLLKKLIKNLASPKAGKLMRSGDYEVAGVFPGGAVFLFVNDRNIDTVGELAGKRIAALDFDKAAQVMVRHVGASMVPAELATFSGMFNNGSVQAAYSPSLGYKALELYKGIGKNGGVIRYPLAQLTFQLVTRPGSMPEGFGEKSRAWAAANFDKFLKVVKRSDAGVDAKHWVDIPDADKAKYDIMFQEVRIRLRDQEKVYDKKMLKLLRKLRCKADGARAECAEKKE